MKYYLIRCVIAFLVLIFSSCSKDHSIEKMEQIKIIGDGNPNMALIMLDSLDIEIRAESDYARHKYDLLRIRLNDKADILPNSDFMIKSLISYFEKEGTTNEKQEVFFYAGSIYRDLQDTPRALEYFFKSLDYAIACNECDSIMLRNTYSNLNFLYYRVQNYNDAVAMALKEYNICKNTNGDDILPLMHIGASYLALDSIQQAKAAFDSAYSHVLNSKDISKHQLTLIHLLNNYSELHEISKAKECFSLIFWNPLENFSAFPCIAFAQYYESLGENDSSIIYCKRILDDGTDINNMYDAAKLLYRICKKMGDANSTSKYADIYLQLSDSLDFGKRQELAATVNNVYQYHLDQKKEQNLTNEKEKYKRTLIYVSITALLLMCIGYIFYIKRRNRHLQVVVALSAELQRVTSDEKQLRMDVEQKEKDLEKSKKSLEKSSDELTNIKRELQRVNAELLNYNEALKAKEQELSEKMDQNKTFIKLLHQSELEGKAEDVVYAIRQSSTGKKNMTTADWKQLYQAVDELYPLFKERLLKELGNFTEQQMQVCYLMRIGLSKPQIQSMTNLSRVTIWRWVKKYDWILTPDGETGGEERMRDHLAGRNNS